MSARSLWQMQGDWPVRPAVTDGTRVDVAVVGAGVTGCACARRLASAGVEVAVLDAREVAAGASGRNGGFASTGTALAFPELVRRTGLEPAVALHRLTEAAMDEMAALAGSGLVRRTGSAWLAGPDEAADLRAAVAAMRDAGIACRIDASVLPERMRPWYEAAAVVEADGLLLPARWVQRLAEAAEAAGAAVYERSPVTSVTLDADGWALSIDGGGHVSAGSVVVACDGLIPALIPALAGIVYPVRGQVIATEPLADTVITLPTHSDHGFFYYRPTDDGRVTLGGGRHLDMDAEYATEERITEPIQAAIETFLEERLGIPAARIEHRWAGIMGFSADMLPVVGELPGSPGLWVCGGYSGVGNVPGFALGQLVADRIAGGPANPVSAALDVARLLAG